MALEDPPAPSSPTRPRSSAACQQCREKKIRCNVSKLGVPCSNCSQRGLPCALRTRKPYPPRKPRRYQPSISESQKLHESPPGGEIRAEDASSRPTTAAGDSKLSPKVPVGTSPGTSGRARLQSTASLTSHDLSLPNSAREKPATGFAAALLSDEAEPDGNAAPYFVGDEQGIGYVLDVFEPGRLARGKHYLIPRSTVKGLASEDLVYLKAKGVFSLPAENVCEALLLGYFHHIHPSLPVVDVKSVLGAYLDGGAKRVNLLLLWSMFSVAANFVDDDVLRQAGYSSRKDMKESMYRRAKCLFECGCEDNKIAIIQSVILISFWYVDTEDRTAAYHWIGIAISMSQTLGLHRDPDSGQRNERLSDRSRRLWRRIWWSCFLRDRWISSFMGRPMRIQKDDCDVPMCQAEDVLCDLTGFPGPTWHRFIPHDLPQLTEYWIRFLELSKCLGDVMSTNYRPHGEAPTVSQIERSEISIRQCSPGEDISIEKQGSLLGFVADHLRLYQQAAIIALYRPFILKGVMLGSAVSREIQETARLKVKIAASKTNSILDSIIAANMLPFLEPMTVPVLVPAMQAHLLESRSTNQLSRSVGLHKLELCLMILREVEETYPAATMIKNLFLEAVSRLESVSSSGGELSQSDRSVEATPSSESNRLPSTFAEGMDVAWLNEVAYLDPWGSTGTMSEVNDEQRVSPDFDINTLFSDDEFQKLFYSLQNPTPI